MRTFLGALILSMATQSLFGFEESMSADAQLLSQHGIELTRDGVENFLRGLKPDEALESAAKKLIAQMGDQEFAARDEAVQGLIELPVVPVTILREAASSTDSEIAYRAQLVLNDPRTAKKLRSAQLQRDVAAAVLRVVRDKPIRQTTQLIVEAAPFLDSWELTIAAADAVAAVAEADDIPLLRQSIASEITAVRMAAIRGLGTAAGESAKAELRELCDDSNSSVVLAAAHALAVQSDRAALSTLIKLLSANDQHIRVRSLQILRALTQRNFALDPYREAEDQRRQLELWQTWLATEGETAPLHLPLEIQSLPEDLGNGLLLHFTFDQDADGQLRDASGHNRNGASKNAFEFISRGEGKALQLSGSGHHGDAGGHAILPFIDFSTLKEFTLAMWVRETGMSHFEGEAYVTFGTDSGVGIEDALGIAHFNAELIFRVGGGRISVPYNAADRDRWVHYVMAFGSGRLSAFRDGRLIDETPAKVSVQSTRAAFGRHWWSDGAGTSARFQGALDDFRVYDRALSQQQIEMLMNITK